MQLNLSLKVAIKAFACFSLFTVFVLTSYCQNYYGSIMKASNGQNKDFIPASPSAASLGIFGQVPIGNFTGIAAPNVPFYTVSYKDLTIPIGVGYHASGNKPDIYPGIVGLGWALNAGGSVTRVVKGLPDYENYGHDGGIIPINYNPLGPDDWSSTANLNGYLATAGFYTDQDRTNPDEFYFNIGGVTGKFYPNHQGAFKVKSSLNTYYDVKVDIPTGGKQITMPTLPQDDQPPLIPYLLPYNNIVGQGKLIYSITITDDHGIKYVFGGTDNSIEFSRPGDSYTIPIDRWQELVTPMTWQLTSVESPNGYKIILNYERGVQVTKVNYCDIARIRWFNVDPPPDPITATRPIPIAKGEKSTLINTCLLTSITTPNETLELSYSDATNQVQVPKDPNIYLSPQMYENEFCRYQDIGRARTENYMIGKKLDNIEIRDKNSNIRKAIHFYYSEDPAARMKLMSVAISGNDNMIGQRYSFEYDPLQLPPYFSYKTDYFGFYNGRNPYITTNDNTAYVNLDQQAFFQSKAPDPAFVQAEILKKIIYPTGGFTTFEYEPNEYGARVLTWPFTTQSSSNTVTGGVRIKKVTQYPAEGGTVTSKTYFYTKDHLFGGTTSSGVLAYQPVFFETYSNKIVKPPAKYQPSFPYYNGTLEFWSHWSTNPIFPLAETRGNHVTYSEVTEINEDGSAIVYKYKNYDNGYNDQEPVNKVTDNIDIKEFWKEDEGMSLDLERGQVLSEDHYDAAKALKLKKVYEYNDDPARFNEHNRILIQTWNDIRRGDINSLRITASRIYTYFPFLKKITQTEYAGGSLPSMETVINYEYDTEFRTLKKQEAISSDGRVMTVLNQYPKDMVAAGLTDPYQDMKTKGMVGILVSSEQQSNTLKVTKNITAFSKNLAPGASLILPQATKTQFKNNPEETKINFNQYDSKGNLVCLSQQQGIKTCYVWSYQFAHPVARIINADYATVRDVLGGQQAIDDFANSSPSDVTLNNFLQPLKTDSRLVSAMVSTYTYDPLTGMTSETGPDGKTTYYEYDFMGRLSVVRDQNHHILKKICYNYAGLPENCNVATVYEMRNFVYSPSAVTICTGNPILQLVKGYSRRPDPETGGLQLFPNEFFTDATLTTHLADGYYRVITNGTVGGPRYQLSGGMVVGSSICP